MGPFNLTQSDRGSVYFIIGGWLIIFIMMTLNLCSLPLDTPSSQILPTGWGLTPTPVASQPLQFWTESRALWRTACTTQRSWLLTTVSANLLPLPERAGSAAGSCRSHGRGDLDRAVTQTLSPRPLLSARSAAHNPAFTKGSKVDGAGGAHFAKGICLPGVASAPRVVIFIRSPMHKCTMSARSPENPVSKSHKNTLHAWRSALYQTLDMSATVTTLVEG